MKFTQFAEYLEKLSSISSRNEMVLCLAELFSSLNKDETKQAVYMVQGRIAPLFIPLEFNFSTKLLLRALGVIAKTSVDEVYKELGDIGLVAEKVASKNKSQDLSVIQVFDKLTEIALLSGKDSQLGKQKLFVELATKVSGAELKFISRIVVGNLRLGASDKTMLDGLSWMLTGDKSLRSEIEHAFGVAADLGLIAHELKENGIEAVKSMQVTVGVPMAAKLVEREKTTMAVIERFGECIIQPKYDGLRVQIHYSKNGFANEPVAPKDQLFETNEKQLVRIFSRRMESLTDMFPDIVEVVKKFKVDSIVLDGEAIGVNPTTGEFMAFQDTMKRKRKFDIAEAAEGIPLKVFCFDMLELNGKELITMPIEQRLEEMEQILQENKNETIVKSESIKVGSNDELDKKFKQYVAEGLEGLIAKGLGTTYDPGTRNFDWIKLKAAAQQELADTVDAVVLGYYKGSGARAKFGVGAILIGVFDEENNNFISLAKVGTGIKDEQWPVIKNRLDAIKVDSVPDNYVIEKNLVPDVIVKPEVVVVVEADSVTKSQVHGGKTGIGYSLRFPRLKEFDRLDKSAEQTTSVKELARLNELSN